MQIILGHAVVTKGSDSLNHGYIVRWFRMKGNFILSQPLLINHLTGAAFFVCVYLSYFKTKKKFLLPLFFGFPYTQYLYNIKHTVHRNEAIDKYQKRQIDNQENRQIS